MTVEVINLQGGKGISKPALTATALFFSGIDNVALTPQTVTPSGGTAPYSFTGVNLPAGITVDAGTGVVSGTPTTPGVTTNASVTVTDSSGVPKTFSCPVFFDIVVGSFSDTFNRSDQPFYVGNLWAIMPLQDSTVIGANIPLGINVAGSPGQLNLQIISSTGANRTILFPITVDWSTVFSGHAQWSECKLNADNTNVGLAQIGSTGPCVLFNANAETGYIIVTNTIQGVSNVVGKYSVVKVNGGGAPTTINNNAGAGFSYAIGDVLRIEGYPNTPVAGQTTIKSYVNGVLKSTDIDSSSPYSSGVFGIDDQFTSNSVTQSWQNYSGGTLS